MKKDDEVMNELEGFCTSIFSIMNRVFDYLTHVTRLLDVIKIQMKSRAFTVKRLWWTLDRFRLNVAFYLQNIFLHNDTEVLL